MRKPGQSVRLSRRRFLAAAPLALVSQAALFQTAAGQTAPFQPKVPQGTTAGKVTKTERTDVVVIGAGISGLALARAVAGKGAKVIVLEARDRIGGRIWTHAGLGVPLDLGASTIRGVSANPITQLAREFRLEVTPINTNNRWRFRNNGSYVRGDDAIDTQFETLINAVVAIRERRQSEGKPDAPLQQGLEAAYGNKAIPSALNYVIHTNIEQEYGADTSQLSLYHYDDNETFNGADVVFPKGLSQVAANVGLGQDVRLSTPVQRIELKPHGVRVITANGDFEAPHVAITLPLGVLKANTVPFSPALPPRKLQAIKLLGTGTFNKCYLHFPRSFWPREPDLIDYISDRKGEWAEWLNVERYLGAPFLAGVSAAAFGVQLEKQTDADIVASAMRTLRGMFGTNIPDPVNALITRWNSDPYARGAFSYMGIGASGEDNDALAEPVGGRLFFAGEATSREYPGTVHGAYLSGLHAAERILAA